MEEAAKITVALVSARLTVPEIAARLQLGERAVYALLRAGEIPSIRLPGGRWIITRYSFQRWLETCGTGDRVQPNVAGK